MLQSNTLLAYVLSWSVAMAASMTCEIARNNLIQNGHFHSDNQLFPCIDPCDPSGHVFANQSDCIHRLFCHWNGSECFLKTVNQSATNVFNNSDAKISSALRNMLTAKPPGNGTTGVDGRTLGVGPQNVPFPWFLPGCRKFPHTCAINPYDPNILRLIEPPVNIPYCQRIPCDSSNPFLEFDRIACHSVPGCYFDVELAFLRFTFGHAFMPGLPVCQMAVRNQEFQKLASNYMQESNTPWNSLLTRCFINEHKKSVLAPSHGCFVLDALEYMGVKPKQAGWDGITENDCYLINGCYKPAYGCLYGVSPKQVQISSGIDKYRSVFPTPREIFGQPKCVSFATSAKPAEYLKNYHSCKQSGCVVDEAVSRKLEEKLLLLTFSYLPSDLRLAYWFLIKSNVVSPDNWKYVADELVKDPSTFESNFRQQRWPEFKRIIALLLNKDIPIRRNRASVRTPPHIFANMSENEKNLLLDPQLAESLSNHGQNGFNDSRFVANISKASVLPLPPCPFHNFRLPGFPALKGSFVGCCESNLCYIPRSSILNQTSGVAAYWAQWSSWSECSATCGKGVRVKTRGCVKFKEQDDCGEDKELHKLCENARCPEWSSWSNWGGCTRTCGRGLQIRRRRCNGGGCDGKRQEKRLCMTENCPVFGPWSRWGSCDAHCAVGVQSRIRACDNSSTTTPCPAAELVQKRRCKDFCGKVVAIRRTKCTGFPDCAVTITYACKAVRGEPKTNCKPFKRQRRRRCTRANLRCRYCGWSRCRPVDS